MMPKKTIVRIARLTGSGRAGGKEAGTAILVGFPKLNGDPLRCRSLFVDPRSGPAKRVELPPGLGRTATRGLDRTGRWRVPV